MNKKAIKIISLVLSLAMVLSLFPANAFAAGNERVPQKAAALIEETSPAESGEPQTPQEPSPPPEPAESPEPTGPPEPSPSIDEPLPSDSPDPNKTTINDYLSDEELEALSLLPFEEGKFIESHDNGDGTTTLNLYTAPVKFKNGRGEWEYIDNSIIQAGSNKFKNNKSDISVFISNDLGQSNAIELQYQGYSIGFRLLDLVKNNGKSIASISFVNDTHTKRDRNFDKTKKYTSVEYENTFENDTGISLTPLNTGIKENIIFNSVPQKTEFSYEIKVQGVKPFLREDGNVYFVDTEKNILVSAIPTPVMYDSSDEQQECADIEVRLEKVDDQTYIYTLIPSRDFLESDTTEYPVYLDPSVNVTGTSYVVDTFVSSNHTGTNYNSDTRLKLGHSATFDVSRGLINITDIPAELENKTITAASYCAYQDYSGASSPTMNIHALTHEWTSSTITWASAFGTSGILKNYNTTVISGVTVSSIKWYTWAGLAAMFQKWADYQSYGPGYGNNYGMLLKIANESLSQYKRFVTCDQTTNASYFAITYISPSVEVSPTAVTNGDITVTWSGFSAGNGITDIQYSTTSATSGFSNIGSTAASGSASLALTEGQHYVWVRPVYSGGPGQAVQSEAQYNRDVTGPTTVISSPETGAFLNGTVNVTGTASDINMSGWALDYGEGVSPSSWTTINSGTSPVSGGALGSWDTGSLTDGTLYTLRISATDAVGNTNNAVIQVTKDSTYPIAAISSPADEDYVEGTVTVTGTAGDINIDEWTLDYGEGVSPSSWTVINTGADSVTNGALGSWDTGSLTVGSVYTLRIRVRDKADNLTTASIRVNKGETVPPAVSISSPADNGFINGIVNVTGTASDDHIDRWILDYGEGASPSTWTEINTGTISVSDDTLGIWDTGSLTNETVYTLRLRVWDKSENIGAASLQMTKDSLVPVTSISSPLNEAYVKGTISIIGTASDMHIREWILEYGSGSSPETWTQISAGTSSIANDELGSLDTSALTDGLYTLRLRAADLAGNSSVPSLKQVTADNTAPSAPADLGCSSIGDTNVSLSWTASADNVGVIGYDVYRDEAYIGSSITTSYIDSGLITGTAYAYTVTAKDAAGNESDASDALNLTTTVSFTYSINADDTLTITGYTGSATDVIIPATIAGKTVTVIGEYSFAWNYSITSVEIPDSVTVIDSYAFCSCSNLTSAAIGGGVTVIGGYAFCFCSNLTSAAIPDGVTIIGNSAFSDCSNLDDVTIPDSVTVIGNSAFYNCTNLTSAAIPDSVTSIGLLAFYSEYLTDFYVDPGNQYYSSSGGVLYNKDQTKLIQYPIGNTASEFDIPSGVAEIGEYAFYFSSNLNDISIPSSVTAIGDNAFNNIMGITSITIPGSVSSIGDYAFANSSITSVTLPDGLTEIGDYTFSSCALTDIVLPDSLTEIKDGAFLDCGSLANITIPDGVTAIGQYAFRGCNSLEEVVIGDPEESQEELPMVQGLSMALESSEVSGIESSGVTKTIGDWAFYGCTTLKRVKITSNVIIGRWAYNECNNLEDVYIKGNADFGYQAYINCASLLKVTVTGDAATDGLGFSFSGCVNLNYVKIGGTASIGTAGFEECVSLVTLSVGKFTRIDTSAFYGCMKLPSIYIDNSDLEIGDLAFADCFGIKYAFINAKAIGNLTFTYCTDLETVYLGTALKRVGALAFSGCGRLSDVYFLGPQPRVGSLAFVGCPGSLMLHYSAQKHTSPPAAPPGVKEADPVDTATGAHTISMNVLGLRGAQALAFTLNYDSSELTMGTMGRAWWNNYDIRLENQSDGSIYVYLTPSSFLTFTEDGEDTYKCDTLGKQNDILTRNAGGSYTLNCNNDQIYTFDASGRLTSIKNRTGMELNVTYTPEGSMVITEPVSGKALTIEYNPDGLVRCVTDSSGRTAQFGYNDINCLTSIIGADGNTLIYTYDSSGRVLTGTDGDGVLYFTDTYDDKGRIISQDDAESGNGLTLFSYDDTTVAGQTTVTITDRNGEIRVNTFNDSKQLGPSTDQNGDTNTYTYDSNGNISGITNALGNTTSITYDDKNRITEIESPLGGTTECTYDSNGNMLTAVDPDGGTMTNTYGSDNRLLTSTDARGTTTTYTYDSNGQVTEKEAGDRTYSYTYENGLVKTTTGPGGGVTTYTYDGAGRVISVTDADNKTTSYTYGANGNMLSETDPLGNTTTYTYDSRGNMLTVTDARGNVTTYEYNGNGKVASVTDPKGNTMTYTYDGEDRLILTTDAQGHTTSTTYDPAGRVLTETDKLGNTTSYTYDAAGNALSTTNPGGGIVSYTYDSNGRMHTETDAEGNTSTYHYDPAGRLQRITNAEGNDTTYAYNDAGELLSVIDPLGNETLYTYDESGRTLTETDPNGNVTAYGYDISGNRTSVTDALGNATHYTYDALNRMTALTDPNGNTTTYVYDAAGRQVSVTNALGETTTTEYDPNGNALRVTDALGNIITRTAYDSMNLPVSIKNALNNETINTYDSLGRLAQTTDPMGNETAFGYSASGQLLTTANALGGVSAYTYDPDGNATSISGPGGAAIEYDYDIAGRLISESTPSGGEITYGYNELNLKSELTNARGQEREYIYDDAGRISSFTDPEGTTSYTYDDNGNILTVTDAQGTITREYDALNRVTEYTDVNGNLIQYTYDAAGNLISMVYPGNKTVQYGYDGANRLITVMDWASRVTSYSYDANGRLLSTLRPDGSELTQAYDIAGRLTGMEDVDAEDNIICSYAFTYDANGRIVTETRSDGEITSGMTYDDIGRITSRVDTDEDDNVIGSYSYAYDAAGNITSGTTYGQTATMAYDAQNRLTTYNGQSVTYDADGNMTNGPLNGISTSFAYDSGNRLIEAGNTEYTYDAENNRVLAATGEDTTLYVFDSVSNALNRLLIKTDPNDESTYYVYGIGLIGQEDPLGNYSVYHFDNRGSTTAVTDVDGIVTDRYTYGVYGDILSHTGTGTTPFLYNGRDGVMTDANGLYYLRARYYSPELMRFVNADTVKGNIKDSRTLNNYAYANGDPVSMVDPFGTSAGIWLDIGWDTGETPEHGTYDSDAALSYAETWYGAHNPEYYWYTGIGGDCANFVSQCLHAGGIPKTNNWHSYRGDPDPWGFAQWYAYYVLTHGPRGMMMPQPQKEEEINTSWWYHWNITLSWSTVDDQYAYFKTGEGKKYVSNEFYFEKDGIQDAINKGIKKGDIMYFDDDGDKDPNHAVMVKAVENKKIFYTGHSRSRRKEDVITEFNDPENPHPNAIVIVISLKKSW